MQAGAAADIARIHLKIGANEFEAEGPAAFVAEYFKAWKQLIAAPVNEAGSVAGVMPGRIEDARLALFLVDSTKKQVALRRYPTGNGAHANAALLLLYGHRLAFGEDGQAVGAGKLKAALASSGHRGARLHRIAAGHVADRLVRKTGRRRGSVYELTPAGFQRAEALANAQPRAKP